MLHVYIDYPVPHMTIHGDPACRYIRLFAVRKQRTSKITLKTLSQELERFADKTYKFAAGAHLDDIWLEIDLNDTAFERAVAEYVLKLIGHHYRPLRSVKPTVHC
jgi:hypothetical protein